MRVHSEVIADSVHTLSVKKQDTVLTSSVSSALHTVAQGPLYLARVWLSQYKAVFKGPAKVSLRTEVLSRAAQGLVASDRSKSGTLTLYYGSEQDRASALARLSEPIRCQNTELIVAADWLEPGCVAWHRFPVQVKVQYWTETTLTHLQHEVGTEVKELVFHGQSLSSFTAFCNFKSPAHLLSVKGGKRLLENGTWMEIHHQGMHLCSTCRVYGHKPRQCCSVPAETKRQWPAADPCNALSDSLKLEVSELPDDLMLGEHVDPVEAIFSDEDLSVISF